MCLYKNIFARKKNIKVPCTKEKFKTSKTKQGIDPFDSHHAFSDSSLSFLKPSKWQSIASMCLYKRIYWKNIEVPCTKKKFIVTIKQRWCGNFRVVEDMATALYVNHKELQVWNFIRKTGEARCLLRNDIITWYTNFFLFLKFPFNKLLQSETVTV